MDIERVWDELIAQLKTYPTINASQVDAFFSRVQIQAVSSDFIMLTSDNSFIKSWIETHYSKDIEQALYDLYQTKFTIQIEVDPTAATQNTETPTPTASTVPQPTTSTAIPAQSGYTQTEPTPTQKQETNTTPSAPKQPAEQIHSKQASFSSTSNLTFDTFVIGESNRMAYSMAVEVADRPGVSGLNPLFIYGRSGVGKTHLLCAIQNYINEQYKDFTVYYVDSIELVNRYSDAAIEKSIDKQSFKNFENHFQQADVLLIDDIQGLQGKPGTLSALFRIFNSMITKGKQFVFSADRAPRNIDLDERYVSRFNSGATIDIQPPEDETKRAIVKSFIAQYQHEETLPFAISNEILDYIVDNSGSNIRELKSAVTNVIFALKMDENHTLSQHRLKELLGNHFMNQGQKRITIEMIQHAVEEFYGITHEDLVGKKKERRIVHPRQVAIYLCRELSESTLKSIGAAFNRDHTTVMHSCDLIHNQLKEDRNLREEIEALREKIRIQQY